MCVCVCVCVCVHTHTYSIETQSGSENNFTRNIAHIFISPFSEKFKINFISLRPGKSSLPMSGTNFGALQKRISANIFGSTPCNVGCTEFISDLWPRTALNQRPI